ncbi:F0F1 ATP synthase subunit A [Botrimarina mediterranea]|uniref:ATP synthase subunit a n=1 Tax=Botrimarina mediterranea TaxID=2528022 RepID=A0A518K6Y5_9BACT|nr:F0F1 ATP synthase subunit A [Botrimarina mediterranea]QDV73548.1 ATP synthase subunit a [Botrimarina mediterranea]
MAAGKNPLSPEVLFEHVQDAPYFHVPRGMAPEGSDGHLYLPQPLATPLSTAKPSDDHDHDHDHDAAAVGGDHHDGGHHGHVEYKPVVELKTGVSVLDKSLLPMDFVFTKFMVIELLVLVISVLLFGWLATRIKAGSAAKGWFANLLETFLLFIRDEVARPTIGEHDADDYLPFLWTVFFFVLGCNLFGMLPWFGSPTASLAVTGAMAFLTFITVAGVGISKYGFAGFLKAQVPHMDLPTPIAVFLVPMIFLIEMFGLFVKHGVLAVRLLANMLAGHIVLAVIIGFISYTAASVVWWGVMPASILGGTALSLLELFVAFLQAYIFVFLSSLFIGSVVHPH